MRQEEQLPLEYKFEFVGTDYNSYIFETDSKIIYEIQFKPTPYLFDSSQEYAKFTFEFVIAVLHNPLQGRPPLDGNTSRTIAKIFEDFYQKFNNIVTIYICESSDNRQMVRHRKFNIWFEEFHENMFLKIDTIFMDTQGIRVPSSLIIKKDNPFRTQIFDEFVKISEQYKK
jgi:hypothetical protein